ncbi:MAG: sulfoxide reductase heme-binding subunit YedZ [Burkholderiales bacterium PBB6]|nr:MAG: sulfoxide reductase heme-binding subunit YedZ [Burkholderiales bacterium PBB6]
MQAVLVNRLLARPAVKPVLWLLLALPALGLLWGAVQNTLGANPAEALIRSLGDWTLRGLCLTLAITPLRQWTGWHGLIRLRRNIGVATFIYGCLHWLAYAWLDQGLDIDALVKDVIKRPFILVGTAAWLAMLPLALTSFNAAIRAMGGRAWKDLHKVTYVIAPVALLHFLWMKAGKQDFAEVTVYALIVGVLLGWRWWRRQTGSA